MCGACFPCCGQGIVRMQYPPCTGRLSPHLSHRACPLLKLGGQRARCVEWCCGKESLSMHRLIVRAGGSRACGRAQSLKNWQSLRPPSLSAKGAPYRVCTCHCSLCDMCKRK